MPLRRVGVPFWDEYKGKREGKGIPLRRIVRQHISREAWKESSRNNIQTRRQGVQEECRYNDNNTTAEEYTKKVYQMHGLSLYCEAEFMNLALSYVLWTAEQG